jgi:heptosyltransferase-2
MTTDMGSTGQESQSFQPWSESRPPERILLIRMHALGDVALTFPAAAALRERFPGARIDYLTAAPAAPLVSASHLFDQVNTIPRYRRTPLFAARLLRTGLRLRSERYDLIVDLQRNWITRMLRRTASPLAWGEFNRFALRPAAERVLETFQGSGVSGLIPLYRLRRTPAESDEATQLLRRSGWDGTSRLVVLNPAGLWTTRHWPVEYYVTLAELWRQYEAVQFLLLGTERMAQRARFIQDRLGASAVNIVGATSLPAALALLGHVSAIVTEDSGLMHMAWASGVPVVALFGSTRHVWSSPVGPHVRVLHSGDLPCGQCMKPLCAFEDVHCLSRFAPAHVLALAREVAGAEHRTGVLT